ncbi:TPA: S8 family serine peptidase [Clostridioides difficile]|nr:S8 family serine peptidase [Clostridioides difficile]MCI9926116.1 S8 family serine peptidase [Clostridioides difficile]MCI9929805.1 S8 family serine peptidase [Clostridioides difficile]MDN9383989.1 S8 family serine peptidase [Clostridioides difficile]HBF3362360.1 S8 family serine peptidase [Clostridioides difficile]
MTKVRIAVLDTGLDVNDDAINGNYVYDSNFQLKDLGGKEINDINGHGTFVSKTILNISKNTQIYPINIFNDSGKTSSLNLLSALSKLTISDIKIINISAASINSMYEKELEKVCNILNSQGRFIICSKHNKYEDKESIPTIFESVIGVVGNENIYKNNQYIYKPKNKIQMYANSKDNFIKFKDKVTHFGKNSKACAVATGIVANILKNNPYIKFNELEEILIQKSKSKEDLKIENLNTPSYKSNLIRLDIARKIINVINKNFSKIKIDFEFVREYSLFNNFTCIGNYNAYNFLTILNKEFNISIDYKEVYLYQLENLDMAVDLIYENLI